jgi:RhoGEF domain
LILQISPYGLTLLSLSFRDIQRIIEDFLSDEETFVENLYLGIQNYVHPPDEQKQSLEIREAKFKIFDNVKEIYELHVTSFSPALKSCNLNLTRIAETFDKFFKCDDFYCYILFLLRRERALQLCNKHKDYFDELQTRCRDKLGVLNFLLQPIQRLPRYQLLLGRIMDQLERHRTGEDVPSLVQTVCQAQQTIERFIVVSNESLGLNDIVQENLVRKL